MDERVAKAYGWVDLELAHGFHETKQGVRFTIAERARREVLSRLLELNREHHVLEAATTEAPMRAKRTSVSACGPLFSTSNGDDHDAQSNKGDQNDHWAKG